MEAEKVFGGRLQQARAVKGVSQQKAADALGISKISYQGYEYGRQFPSFATMPRLADFFNVSVDYLLGRTDVPTVVRSAQWQQN